MGSPRNVSTTFLPEVKHWWSHAHLQLLQNRLSHFGQRPCQGHRRQCFLQLTLQTTPAPERRWCKILSDIALIRVSSVTEMTESPHNTQNYTQRSTRLPTWLTIDTMRAHSLLSNFRTSSPARVIRPSVGCNGNQKRKMRETTGGPFMLQNWLYFGRGANLIEACQQLHDCALSGPTWANQSRYRAILQQHGDSFQNFCVWPGWIRKVYICTSLHLSLGCLCVK